MPPKKNVDVSITPLSATTTKELVADPLDDKELRAVIGKHAKIVPYHELSKYQTIDQLLPLKKDAVVLLYENRPMDGHWTSLTKNNGEISFFDPYGEVIDKQLKYSNYSKDRVQGEGDMSLRNLLSTSKLPVYFNDYKYQRDGTGVNTCGRHVANFIKYNLDKGLDLEDYNELMMKTQKETGLPYDELIAKMVPIHIPHPDDATRVTSSNDIQAQRGLGGAKPFVSGRGFFNDVVEKFNNRNKTPEQIESEKAYQQNHQDSLRGIPPTMEFMTRWLNDRTPKQQEKALRGMPREEFLAKVDANYRRWQDSLVRPKNKFAEGVKGFIDAFDPSTYGRGDGKPFTNKQLTKIILDKNKVIADLEENAYSGGIRGVAW